VDEFAREHPSAEQPSIFGHDCSNANSRRAGVEAGALWGYVMGNEVVPFERRKLIRTSIATDGSDGGIETGEAAFDVLEELDLFQILVKIPQ
jgi:hypothetical protein